MAPHSEASINETDMTQPAKWALWFSVPGFTRKRVGSQLAWFCIWAITTVVAAFLHPDPSGHGTHTQLGLPPCPSVIIWDKPCPACGLTTSFSATVHGHLPFAFQAHPFGPVLYGAFTFTSLLCLIGWLRVRRFEMTRLGNWTLGAVVAAYLVFGMFRFATSPPLPGAGMAVARTNELLNHSR